MNSDRPRDLISCCVALLMTVLYAAPVTAETIAGTDLADTDLIADLPWAFEVTSGPREPGSVEWPVRSRHRFKSTTPIKKSAIGDVYLRTELTTYEHDDAVTARSGFEDLLVGADPDTGLSYAWDLLLLSGAVVYHLHAECTWSEESFQQVAGRLEGAIRCAHQRVACRCGGGCRELTTRE